MAEQLWKGRFSKAVDSRVNDFNSSIRFDQRMIAQDMRGSGVHATMLAKQGIISEQDCEDILNGLASIADDLASGKLEIDPNAEDVHTFVEQTLTARIGDAGKRLHTGRSRNDQVALDIRLTLRDYSRMLQGRIVDLVRVICKKAAENTAAVMPGYTHLQRAQPITFGHALMAYAWMLLRDLQRFEDATARMDAQCPLGSGALAGTTYPLDRAFTAEKLLAERDRECHILLLDVAHWSHILQQRPRRHTGLVDVVQKRIKIVVLQRPPLHLHTAVLVEEMDGAQHRAVAGFLADISDLFVELLLIDLAQDFLAEEVCDLFHFNGHRRVLVGQVGMIRARINGAEGIT